ncbi:LssY C-terminal domain-containing protein [Lysinibacter sp. HNR]|uniref:LssY C-terminal domain-containing protein n=1 Tax=Lysinibacter sp. HNR TaxID=3031408 RepID=UPI0024351BD5|nr:LssY C-terminal domain-containing protein [Lysinibacter sp. HNR]WGD36784.1 LssY C-terminal domain-containing protein [Lysinibacter sp. HNR]
MAKKPLSRDSFLPGVDQETAIDSGFFIFSGAASIWLAVVLFQESLNWSRIWFLIIFWVILAYFVLPRIHKILTKIYLPNYFFGRARTSDGLVGDPVNVALRGSEKQVLSAMQSAGWTLADDLTWRSSIRIAAATLFRRSYDQAPVSPLFLFGRKQDFSFEQEVNGSPGKRHHIRFWQCPPGWLLPGGTGVDWLAAGSYDRAVGLSLFTLQITHKISPDIDAERDFMLEGLTRALPAITVDTIRDFSTGYHSRNGGGDNVVTDGDLPIVDLREVVPQESTLPSLDQRKNRRPASTTFGATVVALRGIAALFLALSLVISNPQGAIFADLIDEPTVADLPGVVLTVIAIIVFLFATVELLLAFFIFRGGNKSRLIAMILSTLAIIVQISATLSGGMEIHLETNLVGFSLDILLMLALTSREARQYATKHRRARRSQ